MGVSKETQKNINLLFKTNPEMKEKLYGCDPEDVVVAYESGDKDAMNYLYQQTKD